SGELAARPVESRDPRRRTISWSPRGGVKPGPFKMRCDFHCVVDVPRPTVAMLHVADALDASPGKRYLEVEPKAGPERQQLADLANRLTADQPLLFDKARARYDHVSQEIANEPSTTVKGAGVGPVQCLNDGSGDAAAKSRLLLALLRLSNIHARPVTGLVLSRGPRQTAHHWVEAWLHERWVPMCPFNHHFGKLPSTYLVFSVGDLLLVKGQQVH